MGNGWYETDTKTEETDRQKKREGKGDRQLVNFLLHMNRYRLALALIAWKMFHCHFILLHTFAIKFYLYAFTTHSHSHSHFHSIFCARCFLHLYRIACVKFILKTVYLDFVHFMFSHTLCAFVYLMWVRVCVQAHTHSLFVVVVVTVAIVLLHTMKKLALI